MKRRDSALFRAHRVIGEVCDGSSAFAFQRLGSDGYITVASREHFIVYRQDSLRPALCSPRLSAGIDAIAARKEITYVATGRCIKVWRRAAERATISTGGTRVAELLLIGPVLLALCRDGVLRVFHSALDRAIGGDPLQTAWDLKGAEKGAALSDLAADGEAGGGRAAEGGGESAAEDDSDSDPDVGDGSDDGNGDGDDSDDAYGLNLDLGGTHGFTPCCMAHPATYVDKVLVGGADGTMVLVNFRRGAVLHRFRPRSSDAVHGSSAAGGECAMTCIEASPALDVVACGFSDGAISVINVRYDRVLFRLSQHGRVTSLSFRSDAATVQLPLLCSASGDGRLYLWDLRARRLHHEEADGHAASVGRAFFAPREPMLITCGRDNALKEWLLDAPDGMPRLLRAREGHAAHPRRVDFYGGQLLSTADGFDGAALQLLSAGADRSLRSFHATRDAQSAELSQGPLLKKARRMKVRVETLRLPPVTAMASCEARERDGAWANVVTAHERSASVHTWSFGRKSASRHVLRQPHWPRDDDQSAAASRDPGSVATSVCISPDGEFCAVGTAGGVIYKYNLQSGQPRGAFPAGVADPPESERHARTRRGHMPGTLWRARAEILGEKDAGANQPAPRGAPGAAAPRGAHEGAVTGVAVDAAGRFLLSCGRDGRVIWWSFAERCAAGAGLHLGAGCSQLALHRDSGLAAFACDDRVVRVADLATRELVRSFVGHGAVISDLCFAGDGRRIASSDADGALRLWDLPTGRCVDWLRFRRPATGIAFSPGGEFLATAHLGRRGISLWADRSISERVAADRVPTEPALMDDPAPVADEAEGDDAGAAAEAPAAARPGDGDGDGDDDGEGDGEYAVVSREPLRAGLITRSTLPRAHWHALFHLELLRERNRPTEVLAKPKHAPFFLPNLKDDAKEREVGAAASALPLLPPPPPAADGDGTPTASNPNPQPKDFQAAALPGWGDVWSDDDDDAGAEGGAMDVDGGGGGGDGGGGGGGGDDDDDGGEWHSFAGMPGSRIMRSRGGELGGGKEARSAESASSRNALSALLVACGGGGGGYESCTLHMMSLAPAEVDAEVRGLCHGEWDTAGLLLLARALAWLAQAVRGRRDAEAVQAYLRRVLKVHGSVLDLVRSAEAELVELEVDGAGADGEGEGGGKGKTEVDWEERSARLAGLRALCALKEPLDDLAEAQRGTTERLATLAQETICLTRHLGGFFSL